MNVLKVSGSPHVHSGHSVNKLMRMVVIAMLPALAASFYYFGLGAIKVTLVAVLACVFFEWIIQKYLIKGPVTITDWSAVITGILLAFNVPSNLPIWMIIVGALVAVGIGKMSFGGLGKNPFNPALVGRVFLLISFPVHMTSWPKPIESASQLTDAVTGPTPLGVMKEGLSKGQSVESLMNEIPSYVDMLFGMQGGSLGEVSAILLLLGGLFLLFTKVISWHIPFSYLGSVLLFSGILWLVDPSLYVNPLFHLVTGGMMLGIFYMATDMVTSPMSKKGMIIFGVGCGILTIVIRVWGAYPEGVSFAILIMNAFVPLINSSFKPKRFGVVKN
jgi:Na+-translocating ferredoxin:NAD+ oxidoreductase subunit D